MFGWSLPPGCGLNEIDELEEDLPEETADMPYYLESEYLLLEEECEDLAWGSNPQAPTDPMDRLTQEARQALDEIEEDDYTYYRRVFRNGNL